MEEMLVARLASLALTVNVRAPKALTALPR